MVWVEKLATIRKKIRVPTVGKARWIALAILAGFMAVRIWDPTPLQTVRVKTFDLFQQIEPRKLMEESPVVVIDLDEESLKEVGQWPWPRNQLAQMTLNLFKMGVRVVGFDIIFAEPDRMNSDSVVKSLVGLDDETKKKILKLPSNDAIFANLIKQARRVVAGQSVLPFERKYEGRKPLRSRVYERGKRGAPKPQEWVPAVPGLLRNIPPIEASAGGHGLLALQPEIDGIVRRVPAFYRYSNRLYPAFTLEVMRLAFGKSGVFAKGDMSGIADITITPGRKFLIPKTVLDDASINQFPYSANYNRLDYAELSLADNKLRLIRQAQLANNKHPLQKFKKGFDDSKYLILKTPSIVVETDRQGRMWPYFSKSDKAKYVSAKDVLSGKVDPKRIRGKLALLGTSATGLLDIKTVPTERFIPGVEVHAQLIESVLTRQFLKRPNFADALEMGIALISGLIIIIIVPWLGAKWALLFFLVIAVGSAGGSWHLFQEYKMIVDAAFGITAVLIIYITLTYLGYANEEAQRRQTRDAFSKYLSPAMVEQVVEDPALLTLGGSKRDMTLLFCDVRGFTSISELFDAEGLTVLINKLLTPLTDIILARNGTIDKYMGDCIMAFWNAPMDDPKHAEDGCRSALAMVEAMAPLNARLEQEAKEEGRKHLDLKVGLGLNSGDAVVGNMGTAQRMDYSVLGDTVNTAARLEGQSKTYGVDIVIGPNTYEQVTQFAIIELDLIQVKGKTVGLQIYALLGDEVVAKDPAFISIKEAVSEMIQVYRNQAWDKAKELIQKVRDQAEAAAEKEVGPILAVKAASSDRFRLDVLCELYESRIRQYESEPPPPDWDGVFIATTK
ncbi:MAG: adenylate/guanylate cyclase domain-containing protein [Pseudomonadota bacterium]|nr:adenylate/guanylate cyclase domain-containing protein [Pseudomonadota bacterium]